MDKLHSQKIYEFENFRLDAIHRLLYKNGQEILLTPKVVETLLALVERSGEVLSKNELMEIVWADSIVEEGNLSQNLYILRKNLSETADGRPLIETLKRRGYRFNGAVSCVEEKSNENSLPDKNQSTRQENILQSADRQTNGQVESANGDFQLQTVKPINAFEACQMARMYFQQMTLPSFIKSRELIDEAVRLDSVYAPAYIALAEQCLKEVIYGLSAPAEGFAGARNALERAVELKADSAEFYAAKGFAKLIAEWDFAGAERDLQKSLAINPHCAFANNYLGQTFLYQSEFEQAEIYLKRSAKIEPAGLYNRGMLTVAYFLARKYRKSIEECEKYLVFSPQAIIAKQVRCWNLEQIGKAAEAVAEYQKSLDEPHGAFTKRWLGYAYALNGEEENARKIAADLAAESREHYLSPIHSAMIHAALNEPDEAILHLENAFANRDPWMLWVAADPRFDNLRTDSRFQEMEKFVTSESTEKNRHSTDFSGEYEIEPRKKYAVAQYVNIESSSNKKSESNKFINIGLGFCLLIIAAFFLLSELPKTLPNDVPDNSPIKIEPSVKLYWQMTEDRQSAFIRERARHIQTLIGDEPTEFDEESLQTIKVEIDHFIENKDSLSQKPSEEGLRIIYGRASQYAPMIIQAYEARQVPPALGLYQAMIESRYYDCLESPTKSIGLFQFIPKTAANYGLTPDDYCNVQKQSDAAAHYMSDAISDFDNNKTLALLAFNTGNDKLREYLRQLRDQGVTEQSAWAILRHRQNLQPPLTDADKPYVPRFFAAAIIGETPEIFELSTPPLTTLNEKIK